MNLKVYILPPLKLIISQAVLNIVVYQMLIVTNAPANSALPYQLISVFPWPKRLFFSLSALKVSLEHQTRFPLEKIF